MNISKNTSTVITLAVVGVIALSSATYLVGRAHSNSEASPNQATTEQIVATPPTTSDPSAIADNANNQDKLLLYLIEEEKLAHDVYTVLYQLYGARVFGNILNSESTHQDRVLTLLEARNLEDPRSDQIGVFTNPELQKLYDQLIAQGRQSTTDAYKVGVVIEEKDIVDITKQLATATDTDIVTTLQALRDGSENHLRAFNRQLGSY